MPWLRIAFIHPLVPVGIIVGLSYLLGRRGEDYVDDVWVLGMLLVLCPPVSAVATAVILRRRPVPLRVKAGLVGVTLVAGVVAVLLGVRFWLDAILIACEGRYECPL